jgi:hypothetical protein
MATCLLTIPGYAHHGSTSQFDQNSEVQVQGVVTKIRLVNPHSYVYFDVTNEDGSVDEWRCEMRAGGLLKTMGWSEEMFADGTHISIVGAPARREPHGCYVRSMSLDGGPTIERSASLTENEGDVNRAKTRADGAPNIAGNWVREARGRGAGPGAMGGAAAMGDAMAMGGAPGMGGGRPSYSPTEQGIAAVADYDREDNPRFHCQVTNILFDWTFDGHVNVIEQSDDKVRLVYGFMDVDRVIHLDMEEHPDDVQPSRLGHSIGKWEGDTLVVDTIGFEQGLLFARPPTAHGEQLRIVERFSLSDDGKTLTRDYRGEDPEYLKEPFAGQDRVVFTSAPYQRYECEDLTEEVVPGF